MTVTQVNLTESGENVVKKYSKKRSSSRIRLRFFDFHQQNLVFSKKKSLHLDSDSDFFHFLLKFETTTQEVSSLLKSSAHRSFSFTRDNLQAFAIHPHSLGDPWFKKH